MKKHLKLFFTSLSLVLIVGLIGLLFFIFQPNLYRNQIESTLNEEFAFKRGSQFYIEKVSGNLLSGIEIQNISYADTSKSLEIFTETLRLKYSIRDLLRGNFTLKEMKLINPYIYFKQIKQKAKKIEADSTRSPGPKISISSFIIENGSLEIEEGKYTYLVEDLNLNGSFLMIENNIEVKVKSGGVIYPSRSLELEGLSGTIAHTEEGWKYDSIQFTALNCDVIASGWMVTSPKLQMGFDIAADINSFDKIFEFLGQDAKLDGKVSIVGNAGGSLSDFGFNFSAYGETEGRTFDEFNFSGGYSGEELELVSFDGMISKASLSGNGMVTRKGKFSGSLSFKDFDINDLKFADIESDINGEINFRGSGYTLETLVMEGDLNIYNSEIKNIHIEESSSTFSIAEESINLKKLLIRLTESEFEANGNLGFDGIINSDINASTISLEEFSNLFKLSGLSGDMSANLTLTGKLNDLNLAGDFDITNLSGKNITFESTQGIFVLTNISSDLGGSGFFHLQEGKLGKIKISSLDVSTDLNDGTLSISNFNAVNLDDYMKFTGWINQDRQFKIDSLSGEFRGYKISSDESILGSREGNIFNVGPVVLNLMGGSIDFSAEWDKYSGTMASSILLKTIDLKLISDIIDYQKGFSGRVSGAITLSNTINYPSIKGLLIINKATHGENYFEDVTADFIYENNILTIDKLKLRNKNDSWLNMSGILNMDYDKIRNNQSPFSGDEQFSFDLALNNVDLSNFKNINPFKQDIGGIVTGNIRVSNTFLQPEAEFDLNLKNGWYDLITFTELQGKGKYDNLKLDLNEINASTENGAYSAYGQIPLNLAMWKIKGRKLEGPLTINATGQSRDLHFLSPYFPEVDKITGDFDMEFALSGTFKTPIRDARFIIKKGSVITNLTQNSPSNIVAELMIEKNMGRIISMSGEMKGDEKKSFVDKLFNKTAGLFSGLGGIFGRGEETGNPRHFIIEGEMDFTSFFRPRLNLTARGEQLYVLSILGEVEAITDMDVTITGQDTIEIAGELIPDIVTIRTEFVEEVEEVIVEESVPYLVYNVHVDLPNQFYLKNSQADIEFSGDIWIIKRPEEEYNFSGNLSSLGGKFYYINDTFEIERANIGFDPYEFNPTFDILATTNIAGEDISVEMGGTLEKPTYSFESENDYSESDIIALINFKQAGGIVTRTGITSGATLLASSYLTKSIGTLGGQLSGFDIFDVQAEPGNLLNAEILVGRRISRSFILTYQGGLSSFQISPQLGLEYKINQKSSLAGDVDRDGLLNVNYKFRLQY